MPREQLTDIYAFSDWLKKEYVGNKRKPLLIEPVVGGLIRVTEKEDDSGNQKEPEVQTPSQ
jgi:hypothetical protein